MTPSSPVRRPESLALIFQEVLTAIERLRGNRQGVTDAEAFRHHTREALKTAANQGFAAGYNADDVRFATFAAVAFLDESILNSQNPIFGDWLRKPLQEELFGTHIAGETFFQNLQQLLGRSDSPDLADVLEVHHLCMLLGLLRPLQRGQPGRIGPGDQCDGGKNPPHSRSVRSAFRQSGRRRLRSETVDRPVGAKTRHRGRGLRRADGSVVCGL